MYRIALGVFLVLGIALLAAGSLVFAQTTVCPDISGSWTSTGKGVEWPLYQGCGNCVCPVGGICPTALQPAEARAVDRTATYTIKQDFDDKCRFYAERFTELQRFDCWNFKGESPEPCDAKTMTVTEHGKWVGIIHDNGTAITMQARPGVVGNNPPDPDDWPALATKLVGKITAVDKKTKKPTAIHVISTASTDAASYWAVVSEATWTKAQPQ